MLAIVDLPKVTKVVSSTAVPEEKVFVLLKEFLESEKTKQRSSDLTGEEYVASSSQTWGDLRIFCNSLLAQYDKREPVGLWREDDDDDDDGMEVIATPPLVSKASRVTEEIAIESEGRRSSKKEAKKEKKEAKKKNKEEKKRKRESMG
jgi:hypothetical protein